MFGLSPCWFCVALAAVFLISRLRYRAHGFTRSYPPLIAALLIGIAGVFLTDLPAFLAFFISIGLSLFGAFSDRSGTKTERSSPWEPDLTESDRIAEERALQEELDHAKLPRAEHMWSEEN